MGNVVNIKPRVKREFVRLIRFGDTYKDDKAYQKKIKDEGIVDHLRIEAAEDTNESKEKGIDKSSSLVVKKMTLDDVDLLASDDEVTITDEAERFYPRDYEVVFVERATGRYWLLNRDEIEAV